MPPTVECPSENPGRVFIYDLEQGRMRVPDGSGHSAAVSSLAFGGGGRWLVSASYDHTVRMWDLETLESVKTLTPRQDPNGLAGLIQAVAASADEDLVASVTHEDRGDKGQRYSVQIWNAETGEESLSLPGGCASPASLAFSPDNRHLAVGTHDRLVHVWDPASGTERWKLEGHSDQVSAVAFSPDGRTLASGGHDKTVNFWDLETGERLGSAGGLLDKVVAIGFLGDGGTLVVAGADGTIQWREAPTGRVQGTLAADATFGALTAMAMAPGGDVLAGAYADGNVRLWSTKEREIERSFPLVPGGKHIKHLAFSPEGRHLAVALSNGSIYLLRVGESPRHSVEP